VSGPGAAETSGLTNAAPGAVLGAPISAEGPERRAALERDLARILERERRLADAIARGGDLDPLLAALKAEQAARAAVQGELEATRRRAGVASLDSARVVPAVQARAADVRALLGRQPAQARGMLQHLLVGKLTLTPVLGAGRADYRFAGQGSYGPLLVGQVVDTSGGSPNGKRQRVSAGPPL
jgi:hypothetical protein